MSIAGGCERAVNAAHAVGFQTVQLFTKNNNQWNAPPLLPEQSAAFRQALEQTGIVDPVSHTSYLINLASPDEALWKKSIDAMVVEVQQVPSAGDRRPGGASRGPHGRGGGGGLPAGGRRPGRDSPADARGWA